MRAGNVNTTLAWRPDEKQTLTLVVIAKASLGCEVNDAGALEIRWTAEGDLIPQELADVVVYYHGGDNEDDEDVPEMDSNVDLIFEP